MNFNFLSNSLNLENIVLPESDKINKFLLKNHSGDILKALDFLASDNKLLYVHGFLGTGKRQFIDYIGDFLNADVIKLNYICKASTVCDDILLSFIDIIEKMPISKAVNHTAKITTLAVKLQQYISSIKKPFLIILHSFDDIEDDGRKLITDCFKTISENSNVKIIISTRAMHQNVFGDVNVDKKIILKAFSKEIFKECAKSYKINGTDDAFNDFYKYSRGYYYYTLLSIKIMESMKLTLNDFLSKYTMSGMSFDSFLGMTYINLIPNAIRNFFWFLCSVRHGISLNALAILELYDEYSITYLKSNLMIYQEDETLYVQDYFQQDIDISIPIKTEIRLHKYIVGIYKKELKESLQARAFLLSRQALRAEIDYHNKKIKELESGKKIDKVSKNTSTTEHETSEVPTANSKEQNGISSKMEQAKKLSEEKKYTDAIETYLKIIDENNIDSNTLAEIRVELARLYMYIEDYEKAKHYYEIAEKYYKNNNEFINLNYLYYELMDLYFKMYKTERAIEVSKKVIYSVDTPQSLMVDACIRLGNIYSETNKPEDAYKYYIKALESFDEHTPTERKSELYFKLALVCDEQENDKIAFEYYNECIQIKENNPYIALAYSNLGACYYENNNYSDAENCFITAYNIEKSNNNYEGIYYTSSYLAKLFIDKHSEKALDYLLEAKQSAEFINEDFSILESTIELGDYYYNRKDTTKDALIEYFRALKIGKNYGDTVDIKKIEERIQDMKLRMDGEEFETIKKKYG